MKRFASFFLALALALAFAPRNVAAKSGEEKEEKDTKEKKNGKGKEEKKPKFDIPIPPGHTGEGLTIPYYNERGKLQMSFKIKSATRMDSDHLLMEALVIEMFDENGKPEMSIDAPRSMLDLNTRIVTSEVPVTIRRSDFEITGDAMQFDTEKRSGRMVGKVRMLIYNKDEIVDRPKATEETDATNATSTMQSSTNASIRHE